MSEKNSNFNCGDTRSMYDGCVLYPLFQRKRTGQRRTDFRGSDGHRRYGYRHSDPGRGAGYVVSTGDTIRNLPFAYTVDSWQLTKQNPGDYQLREYPNAEYDSNMNILNDYSYVAVDITVENLRDREVTQYIWGFINLKLRGAEESYIGSATDMINLDTDEIKPITKDANRETFAANERRKERLIYIVPDDLLPYCDGFYLRIEHTEGSDRALNKLDAEVRRWIVLN